MIGSQPLVYIATSLVSFLANDWGNAKLALRAQRKKMCEKLSFELYKMVAYLQIFYDYFITMPDYLDIYFIYFLTSRNSYLR